MRALSLTQPPGPCTACHGSGTVVAILCGSGCLTARIPCHLCTGTGTVSAERLATLDRAEALRSARIRRGLTLRQVASATGLTPQRLSQIEHGVGPEPTPELYQHHILAIADLYDRQHSLPTLPSSTCIECGCTDAHACISGCARVDAAHTLCSRCAP